MATPAEIGARFDQKGGRFVQSPDVIAVRLQRIRALVFDWDGVFNRGEKSHGLSSGFSEADSMGVNMLRYALWRRDGHLPLAAIITGERNPTAEQFAQREHFHALYQGVRDKAQAMADFRERHRLEPADIACVFDDINDIAMAADCGLRVLVRRKASEMLQEYLVRAGACDYVTACAAGSHPVREAAEILMCFLGCFEDVVASRCANDAAYRAYLDARQAVALEVSAAEFAR